MSAGQAVKSRVHGAKTAAGSGGGHYRVIGPPHGRNAFLRDAEVRMTYTRLDGDAPAYHLAFGDLEKLRKAVEG